MRPLLAMCLLLPACVPYASMSGGCTKDTDCAAGRVCELGSCVNAGTSGADATGSGDGAMTSTTQAPEDGSDGMEDVGDSSASDTGFEGDPIATDCDACLDWSDANDRSVACSQAYSVQDVPGPVTLTFSGDRPASYDGMPCGAFEWTDTYLNSCIGSVQCGTCTLDVSRFADDSGWGVLSSCGGIGGFCPIEGALDNDTADGGPQCLNCGEDGVFCDDNALRRCTDGEVLLDCNTDECKVDNVFTNCHDRDTGHGTWRGPGCYTDGVDDASCLL